MNSAFIMRMRQRLKQIEAEHRELINSLEGGFDASMTASVGELSSVDNHSSDLGNETMERQKDLGLLAQLESQLARCEEALQRIEQGRYGLCEGCGRRIEEARLEALPYAQMCIDCQTDGEERVLPMRSPEEELLFPPYGRGSYGEHQIDRDDAWEIVARHGTANTPQDTPEAYDDDDDGMEKGNG